MQLTVTLFFPYHATATRLDCTQVSIQVFSEIREQHLITVPRPLLDASLTSAAVFAKEIKVIKNNCLALYFEAVKYDCSNQ